MIFKQSINPHVYLLDLVSVDYKQLAVFGCPRALIDGNVFANYFVSGFLSRNDKDPRFADVKGIARWHEISMGRSTQNQDNQQR